MSPDYADLVATMLAVPPRPPGPSWAAAESAIGTTLPGDYKELLDRTGAVTVADYLCLTGPDLASRDTSIAQLVEERERAWTRFRAGGVPLREEFFAGGARLLAFASVEAIYFFWHARPEVPPDDWRVVVVDADLDGWHQLDMSATECLYRVLSGELHLDLFDDLFTGPPYPVDR